LRTGAIQEAVVAVLALAASPLRAHEIHRAVERQLGRPVSLDTVASFLSVASRDVRRPVVRVEVGTYSVTVGPISTMRSVAAGVNRDGVG